MKKTITLICKGCFDPVPVSRKTARLLEEFDVFFCNSCLAARQKKADLAAVIAKAQADTRTFQFLNLNPHTHEHPHQPNV